MGSNFRRRAAFPPADGVFRASLGNGVNFVGKLLLAHTSSFAGGFESLWIDRVGHIRHCGPPLSTYDVIMPDCINITTVTL